MTRPALDLDAHLDGIAAADPGAFARWVAGAEHGLRDGLRSFAASVDVEAVLQEALLRTWQIAPRVRPDGRPNALFRMAATIARNLALSELRRRRPARNFTDDMIPRSTIAPTSAAAAPNPLEPPVINTHLFLRLVCLLINPPIPHCCRRISSGPVGRDACHGVPMIT